MDNTPSTHNTDAQAPQYYPVHTLKRGEYIKRKQDARKVYKLAGYCRLNKAYQLDDCDDISRAIYVKKGTAVFAGFTY